MKDSSNQERHGQFFNSTQEFLDCLQSIRSVLGTEIDILSETESEKEEESLPAPQESSTPSNSKRGLSKEAVTVPERMVKRNVHHTKTHPKFIGGLGGKHKHYPQVSIYNKCVFESMHVHVCMCVCVTLFSFLLR